MKFAIVNSFYYQDVAYKLLSGIFEQIETLQKYTAEESRCSIENTLEFLSSCNYLGLRTLKDRSKHLEHISDRLDLVHSSLERIKTYFTNKLTDCSWEKIITRITNAEFDIIEAEGAFEIPLICKFAIESKKYEAILAVGCVIRGETSHYDVVVDQSARALMNLSLEYSVPITNGILTVDNKKQALERADPLKMNKGAGFLLTMLKTYCMKELLREPIF